MSEREPELVRRLYDPEVYQQLLVDLQTLEQAARGLRRIGWFLFGTSSLITLTLLMFAGVLGAPLVVPFAAILYAWVFFYFFLGKHVQRGRRWAIAISMVLNCSLALVSVTLAVYTRNKSVVFTVIETLVFVSHLNLIKLLVQSWIISRRIDALIDPPVEEFAVKDERLLELD